MREIRATSMEAYMKIKANGLLSKRRLEAYEILFNHGPMTANDLDRYYLKEHPNSEYKGLARRLSELKKLGVVEEIGTDKDKLTNHRCYLWDVTNHVPTKQKLSKYKGNRHTIVKEILDVVERKEFNKGTVLYLLANASDKELKIYHKEFLKEDE